MLSRLTIQDMHVAAKEKGGRCLSATYVNNATHLKWECKEGHRWIAIPSSIRRGIWCPHCAQTRRTQSLIRDDGLDECYRIAHSKGGECLSTKYEGNKVRLTFRCQSGHEWKAAPYNIFAGNGALTVQGQGYSARSKS